ncbi:MAG: DNA/RNA non-specific endonuclease [Patescibacteria group bacterium]
MMIKSAVRIVRPSLEIFMSTQYSLIFRSQNSMWHALILLIATGATNLVNAADIRELIPGKILEVHYEGFTVWLDCMKRGAFRFEYTATKDTGTLPRVAKFLLDSDVPGECQQESAATYRAPGVSYDRGHLVPANHLDGSAIGIRQSNFMTNILPQAASMNRGAWLHTEEIIECYRDIKDLHVVGGVIWGFNPHDDYFLESHGVVTADYFWKVVIASDDAIAWIVPNSDLAKANMLDAYLVDVATIERLLGEEFDLPTELSTKHPEQSWPIPDGCNKG